MREEGTGWMQWFISLCLYEFSNVLLNRNLYSAFSFDNVFSDDRMHSEERLLFSSLKQKSPADTEMKTCLFLVLYVCFRSKMVILYSQHDVRTCRVLKTRAAVLSLHYGCRIGASVNKLTLHQWTLYPKRNSGCPCHKLMFEWPSGLQVLFWIQLFKICSP